MSEKFLDCTIWEIVTQYPETRAVFINNGFPVFADDTALAQLGLVLKLKTALKSKCINAALFLQLLEDKIAEQKQYQAIESTVAADAAERFNLVALLPCPLKVPLQSEFKNFLEQLRSAKQLPLTYFIDAFFNNHLNYEEYLQNIEEPDEIPDVLVTAGFSFLFQSFMDRFVQQGIFAKALERPVNPRLGETGIVDPTAHFTVLAVNTLVMVVDKKRLGKLPLPAAWGDLLRPEYENQVVIRGHDDVFCDIVQLNFFKDYGSAGLEQLGRSVRYGLHPAEMVKDLLSSRQNIPPIYVMPYFFYKTIKASQHIEVIWPKEGILAYPVSMMIKAEKLQEFKELSDYLTGDEVAAICANAYFPAVNPAAPMQLPEQVKFKWLGWEFIRNHNMEHLLEELNDTFLKAYRRKGGTPCS